ncbi:MAG: RNA polymerase sigma factor [Saprospiraceae bacterium]|nr:RNA polymerase sigma factor [Saprospiraceae bacterium]
MTNREFSDHLKQNMFQIKPFAKKLTKSEQAANDLVQDASLRAYQHREKLNEVDKFKSWFNTIMYNTFLNQYKKRARRRRILNSTEASVPRFFNKSTDVNDGYEKLKHDDVFELCQRVGDSSYKAFVLYYEGYSYKEIAKKLKIAIGTVKSRIHFARSKMKKLTKKHSISV